MEIDYNVLILCGICIFLLIMNVIEKWQHTKREDDLLDRLMADDHHDYVVNQVIAKDKPQKPGKVDKVADEEEGMLRVD
ncbi:MAG: hypothetical protein BBJ57_07430 [Desulfobacterales bacterium PC51MH44]|nr:MAG: hypothetical protein BBJ57_07430 [Desulfobacterales bacterium PC51MH44]